MDSNIRIVLHEDLPGLGFTPEEIEAAKERDSGYVGERNGLKYYRQQDLNINFGEHKTRSARLPDQQGDR